MKKYYAVIGRIPYDDEDTCLIFEAEEGTDVRQLFEDAMYEEIDNPEKNKAYHEKNHGAAVYINHILVSDTEIRED